MPSPELMHAYLQQRALIPQDTSRVEGFFRDTVPNVLSFPLGGGDYNEALLDETLAARRGAIMAPHPYQEAGNVPEGYFNMMDELPREDILWPSYEQELVVGGISEPMGQWPMEGTPVGATAAPRPNSIIDLSADVPVPYPEDSMSLDELMDLENRPRLPVGIRGGGRYK